MKKLCLNSGHNSSKNLDQNFNRIATIICEAAPSEYIRQEIKKNSSQNSGPVSVRIPPAILKGNSVNNFGQNSWLNSGREL